MAKQVGTVGGYVVPALLGVLIAVLVGLYLPQLVVNATESGMGFMGNVKGAFGDTMHRLNVVTRGNFHDTAAWSVPAFGFVTGCFFRFITREDT